MAALDAVIITVSYAAALSVRFLDAGGVPPTNWWGGLAVSLPAIVAVHLSMNLIFGTYGHVWEFASVEEGLRIVAASMTSALGLLAGLLAYRGPLGGEGLVPISALVLGAFISLSLMGMVRFWSRMFSYRRIGSPVAGQRPQRTLIVGTGGPAANLARYHTHTGGGMDVIGFVEPNGGGSQRRLAGLPVVGTVSEVASLIERHDIDQVVIAAKDPDGLGRQLIDSCTSNPVRFRILPDIESMLASTDGIRDVRDLELTDLLPRQTVKTDLDAVAGLLAGKRIMVTGGGGSIGSEIVRQILRFDPEVVLAVDHDETLLHEAALRWQVDAEAPFELLVGDIRDWHRMERLFERHRPEIVFHAAALKHVPLQQENPEEAFKTNVLGTQVLLDAAREHGVEHFVLISTDKAVEPSSVMGATKRMAEMILQARAAQSESCTYSAVRFGNVLGSRGSVVPTFKQQIQAGGPVTVTHPAMERYFMTVDEAVQLVLQAAALADRGEIFVLDMGQPVKILDLANRMIRLQGLVPGRDIEVQLGRPRPGEKLSETLAGVPLTPSAHRKVMKARPGFPGAATLHDAVELLHRLADEGDADGVRETLLAMAKEEWSDSEVVDLTGDTARVVPFRRRTSTEAR